MGPTLLFGIGMSAAWSFVRYRLPNISPVLADAGIAAGLILMALSLVPGVRLPVIGLAVVGAACLVGAASLHFSGGKRAPAKPTEPEVAVVASPRTLAPKSPEEPRSPLSTPDGKPVPNSAPPAAAAKIETNLSPAPPAMLRQLTQLYITSHDGISAEMLAGLELPRAEWLNEQLEKYGANWRVRNVQGPNAEIYSLHMPASRTDASDAPDQPALSPGPLEISREQAKVLTRGFAQMRQDLAGVWVDRPMSGPTPQAWSALMEALNRAGIEAVSDLQNPSHPDQTGIVICVSDPKRPTEIARKLRALFAEAKITTTFDVISDRQRLRKDDAPSLVIYVAPAPL